MLDRAAARDDGAPSHGMGSGAGLMPLSLAEVPAHYVPALSAFYRHRQLPKVQLAGRIVGFAPRWRRELPEIPDAWTLAIKIDDRPAELVVPEALLSLLLEEFEGLVSFDALSPEHSALILEYALAEALDALETALGCSVALSAVREPSDRPNAQAGLALLFTVETQGMDPSWCVLRVGEAHMLRVAQGLDRLSGAPAADSLIDLPVPTRIRWAAVDLTLGELQSLCPGDILLVDAYCMEPETALAVMGDHLIAPVKILPKGYQLLDAPAHIAGSGYEWCANRLPMQTGPFRDGTPKDLPLRLFVEMNRFDLSLTGLYDLGRGTHIGTEEPRKTHLDVVVEGMTVGWGELTVLGIGLGIRLIRI